MNGRTGFSRIRVDATSLVAALLLSATQAASAHHSFAMYDSDRAHTFTGVVTRVVPNSAHLIIHFVPLDDARRSVVRSAAGEPLEWTVELGSAASAAGRGISVNGFPRGSIISLSLHPLRNGGRGGGLGEFALYKCPPDTPPEPELHCDSVDGATRHSDGALAHDPAIWDAE